MSEELTVAAPHTAARGGLFAAPAAGLSAEAALATALLYRLATFYLPPIWGFVALVWLRRNRHL